MSDRLLASASLPELWNVRGTFSTKLFSLSFILMVWWCSSTLLTNLVFLFAVLLLVGDCCVRVAEGSSTRRWVVLADWSGFRLEGWGVFLTGVDDRSLSFARARGSVGKSDLYGEWFLRVDLLVCGEESKWRW